MKSPSTLLHLAIAIPIYCKMQNNWKIRAYPEVIRQGLA
jgi:hypothetical protein